MKKLLLSSAIVLVLFAPSAIAQQQTSATVASVGDGDTIRVKENNSDNGTTHLISLCHYREKRSDHRFPAPRSLFGLEDVLESCP